MLNGKEKKIKDEGEGGMWGGGGKKKGGEGTLNLKEKFLRLNATNQKFFFDFPKILQRNIVSLSLSKELLSIRPEKSFSPVKTWSVKLFQHK